MGILSDDMKRVVREQRLGYIATVCPDGTPNLSPKGTTAVWDDDHLVFAIVMVRVHSALPIDSPAYDLGLTEDEVRSRWEHHFQSLRAGKTTSPAGEQPPEESIHASLCPHDRR